MSDTPDKITDVIRRFDALPDDAIISTAVTAQLTSLCEKTVRYHPKLKRHYVSADRYGQRVGDVRRLLRGERHEGDWQQLGDIAQEVCADIRDHQRKMQAELNRRKAD